MANHKNDDPGESPTRDFLAGPVPEPGAEATASERAHARTFADLVDKTLAGRTPPAMSADDRALLEVATVIRAAHGKAELPAARQRAAIEDALRAAVGGAGAGASGASGASGAGVVPIERARSRRWAPWALGATTLVAAAAAVLLWVRGPQRVLVQVPAAAAAAQLPAELRSRPADPLIGVIARERAGDATARIDTIFADRLDGYRERRLQGGKR
jgi:hypothetical protein